MGGEARVAEQADARNILGRPALHRLRHAH